MRRVHRIYALRTLSSFGVAFASLALVLWGIGREVWVAKVFENMPSLTNVPAMLSFGIGAFVHTDLFVQILSIAVVAATVWCARECARVLKAGEVLRGA